MTRWLAQGACFALFFAAIGFFSIAPAYQYLAPGQALLRLSISHAGQLLGACRERSAAELNKLSRNMRAPQDCPRERAPLTIELDLDGAPLYRALLPPTGWSRDGAASVYRRFVLPAGEHRLAVRLKDSAGAAAFDYQRSATVRLLPAQVMVIDFDRQQGGVLIK